jgi:hypothetical protein
MPGPPQKNRELYVVAYPDGREVLVESPRKAWYKAMFGPIGTMALSVQKGQRTLFYERKPDPEPQDTDGEVH